MDTRTAQGKPFHPDDIGDRQYDERRDRAAEQEAATMNSTKQETSLLTYVIAYLQEEANDMEHYRPECSTAGEIQHMVNEALDAYAGGAR